MTGLADPFLLHAESVLGRRSPRSQVSAAFSRRESMSAEEEEKLEFLRQLIVDDHLSLEATYNAIQYYRLHERAAAEARKPSSTKEAAPDSIEIGALLAQARTTPGIDLLSGVIAAVRPIVADQARSTKQRIRVLWAAAKAARGFGSSDVVHTAFMTLAIEAGLIDRRGW